MAAPCNFVHRFCMATMLERRGKDNAREFGFGINTRADAASANPDAGTVEIVADPLGGDFNTLRLDSDFVAGTSNGADLTIDLEWKRAGRADGGGTTNNVQQFSPLCMVGQCAILSATFGAAATGYVTILNTATSTAATSRDFELRVFKDGSANLVNRTTGPTVSLTAGTIPTDGTRFIYYVFYQANSTGTNGIIEFGVSTNGGSSWTTSSSTSATITNAAVRRIRIMVRVESTQALLLDGGIPEVCYDWFGVAAAFLGNGSNSVDTGYSVADLRDRATYNPFFDFKTGGVTDDGFTVCCTIKDDDFDDATPTITYEVYDDSGTGGYDPADPIPVDPSSSGALVASGTLTPAATWRIATDRVSGLDPYVFYFVQLTCAGVTSHWVRVRTAHTADQGRKLIKLGFFGHIQNTGEKRPCIAAHWVAQRELDELFCVGKRWHNDNNGDRSPGVSAAKAADIFLNSMQDAFLLKMYQNTPCQPLFAEYEGGWTNTDSRYDGSVATMGTIDGNWNYDNTGSSGDRGDNVVAGDAWTAYTEAVEATVGPFAVDEPTAGCLYYSRIRGRVKFIHVCERLYRDASGNYLGADQINWIEDEIVAEDGCDLVVIVSPSSWCDEDATSDDSYGSPDWIDERDVAVGRVAYAASTVGKRVLFVSDCKFTPFVVTTPFAALAAPYQDAIVACVGLGKTAGRVPANGYDVDRWVENGAVTPKTRLPGIPFSYLALPDADADQNDLTDPISGDTTGVDSDDAVMFWGEVWIDEDAKSIQIMAFRGTDGQPLTDTTFGTFSIELGYGDLGGTHVRGVREVRRVRMVR